MSRKRRESPKLKRSAGKKPIGRVHWVFCEGETEKRCLNDLRVKWRMQTLKVQLVGSVGVPWTIVEKAKEKRDELKRTPKGLPWTIHVVFDRDEHPRFKDAIDRARAVGFTLGVSVPCFELWALLLHRHQTAHITRQNAQSELKKVHDGYCHNSHPYLDVDTVISGLSSAEERSKVLSTRAQSAGGEFANPSSTFSDVVNRILVKD